MNKTADVTQYLNKLNAILEQSQNPKILWEEMKILSATAFDLQDTIMALLDKQEATEKDLSKLQALFDAREIVWDLINKIALRELEIKEKTHTKKAKVTA